MRKFLAMAACLAALGSGAALAEPPLLGQDQFDPRLILPPPPAPGSPIALAEIAELKAIAAASSPELLAAAKHDAEDESADIFNGALGFDVMALPATRHLLDEIGEEEDIDSKVAKNFFHRPRPWIANPEIAGCEHRPAGNTENSYPSGHSTLGFSTGIVLAVLLPDKAQVILARASEYAAHRMICGVHFRSDIVAGQQFGTVLGLRLMENPAFQKDMDAARRELRAARLAP